MAQWKNKDAAWDASWAEGVNLQSSVVQQLKTHPAMQGMQIWSLAGDLRSHMPWSNEAHRPQPESPCTTGKEAAGRHGHPVPQPRPNQHGQINTIQFYKSKELDFGGRSYLFFFFLLCFYNVILWNHIDTRWYNLSLCLVSLAEEILYNCPHHVGTSISEWWSGRSRVWLMKSKNLGHPPKSLLNVGMREVTTNSANYSILPALILKTFQRKKTLPQRDPPSNTFLLKKPLTL